MKVKYVLTAGVALGVLSGALASSAPALAADEIKIGDINSYTRLPAHTVPYRRGAMLAIEEINKAGGVLGKKLVFVSRDDQGKPGEAVKVAEELRSRDKVALVSGSLFSHIGLALASWAKQRKTLYLAAEPLADALVWAKGNNYTFRLRPSTYMQAAMLAAEAAKRKDAKRWATIAPNYAYGKDAVAAFQKVLKKLRPDVTFVGSQWPGLFKIDAGAEVQALAAMKPDAIYNVTFGSDLAKFVREGRTRGLFKGKLIVGLLTGEPEYIDPLKDEAPVGWLVTGYPWQDIDTPAHKKFLAAYQARWNDYPRIGSIVGYNTMLAIQAMLKKAGSTDTDKMVAAMKGLSFDAPTGPITFRAVDHQSTMGAYVGWTVLKDGKGTMERWQYLDGANYLPSVEETKKLRKQ
ncbi:MAG: ABC transporter substrate-binding protein [Rhodospirillaceae bacterium]|nr:ABC transporter substrate-binding protein [Rhodospirillaceae bacterium]MCY4065016.1 ABC transporter substrate-binding protein [Rhodospirillaceae bacterium]